MNPRAQREQVSGPLLFAKFAYPPNALGYCGPDDSSALLQYAVTGTDDPGLRQLARGFEGAWPYLQLIAAANHIADALDPRVVEAYWIGNALLDQVPIELFGNSLDGRFRRIADRRWQQILDRVCAGAVPHHNFHVFSVYPWVGMLRGGLVDQPLRVLDRCRVRWGWVKAVDAGSVVVESRLLGWDGVQLALGTPVPETASYEGERPDPGDWLALHWDWACTRLSARQLRALQGHTFRELAIANQDGVPGPAAALT